MTSDLTIVVLAKEPRPGRVKTRLTPPCTPEQAAALAAAALSDTLDAVARAPARRRVLALEGRPGAWLPSGFEIVAQPQGGLDARIAGALDAADGPALLIGMDTPQVTPGLLRCDFDACPAWLGPAADGGFWALGLARPDPDLVLGVPMSVPWTHACQHRRLVAAGLAVGGLPGLRDVDTWADAGSVAAQAAHTRFAATVAEVAAATPGMAAGAPELAGPVAGEARD